MLNSMLENLNIIIPLIIFFLIDIFLFIIFLIKYKQQIDISKKIDEIYSKIHNDINFAVVPNSINLSPSTDDFIQFAIEVWRIEQRMIKIQNILPENQKKGVENSTKKLKRYFEKYDIEIIDYTNQKFNDGLNLDVLSVEKKPNITEPIIKETIEPTIMYRGQVVRKAKIIVLTKGN
jgi:multisubunit Na+/H+ antiporter MnhE subunit